VEVRERLDLEAGCRGLFDAIGIEIAALNRRHIRRGEEASSRRPSAVASANKVYRHVRTERNGVAMLTEALACLHAVAIS